MNEAANLETLVESRTTLNRTDFNTNLLELEDTSSYGGAPKCHEDATSLILNCKVANDSNLINNTVDVKEEQKTSTHKIDSVSENTSSVGSDETDKVLLIDSETLITNSVIKENNIIAAIKDKEREEDKLSGKTSDMDIDEVSRDDLMEVDSLSKDDGMDVDLEEEMEVDNNETEAMQNETTKSSVNEHLEDKQGSASEENTIVAKELKVDEVKDNKETAVESSKPSENFDSVTILKQNSIENEQENGKDALKSNDSVLVVQSILKDSISSVVSPHEQQCNIQEIPETISDPKEVNVTKENNIESNFNDIISETSSGRVVEEENSSVTEESNISLKQNSVEHNNSETVATYDKTENKVPLCTPNEVVPIKDILKSDEERIINVTENSLIDNQNSDDVRDKTTVDEDSRTKDVFEGSGEKLEELKSSLIDDQLTSDINNKVTADKESVSNCLEMKETEMNSAVIMENKNAEGIKQSLPVIDTPSTEVQSCESNIIPDIDSCTSSLACSNVQSNCNNASTESCTLNLKPESIHHSSNLKDKNDGFTLPEAAPTKETEESLNLDHIKEQKSDECLLEDKTQRNSKDASTLPTPALLENQEDLNQQHVEEHKSDECVQEKETQGQPFMKPTLDIRREEKNGYLQQHGESETNKIESDSKAEECCQKLPKEFDIAENYGNKTLEKCIISEDCNNSVLKQLSPDDKDVHSSGDGNNSLKSAKLKVIENESSISVPESANELINTPENDTLKDNREHQNLRVDEGNKSERSEDTASSKESRTLNTNSDHLIEVEKSSEPMDVDEDPTDKAAFAEPMDVDADLNNDSQVQYSEKMETSPDNQAKDESPESKIIEENTCEPPSSAVSKEVEEENQTLPKEPEEPEVEGDVLKSVEESTNSAATGKSVDASHTDISTGNSPSLDSSASHMLETNETVPEKTKLVSQVPAMLDLPADEIPEKSKDEVSVDKGTCEENKSVEQLSGDLFTNSLEKPKTKDGIENSNDNAPDEEVNDIMPGVVELEKEEKAAENVDSQIEQENNHSEQSSIRSDTQQSCSSELEVEKDNSKSEESSDNVPDISSPAMNEKNLPLAPCELNETKENLNNEEIVKAKETETAPETLTSTANPLVLSNEPLTEKVEEAAAIPSEVDSVPADSNPAEDKVEPMEIETSEADNETTEHITQSDKNPVQSTCSDLEKVDEEQVKRLSDSFDKSVVVSQQVREDESESTRPEGTDDSPVVLASTKDPVTSTNLQLSDEPSSDINKDAVLPINDKEEERVEATVSEEIATLVGNKERSTAKPTESHAISSRETPVAGLGNEKIGQSQDPTTIDVAQNTVVDAEGGLVATNDGPNTFEADDNLTGNMDNSGDFSTGTVGFGSIIGATTIAPKDFEDMGPSLGDEADSFDDTFEPSEDTSFQEIPTLSALAQSAFDSSSNTTHDSANVSVPRARKAKSSPFKIRNIKQEKVDLGVNIKQEMMDEAYEAGQACVMEMMDIKPVSLSDWLYGNKSNQPTGKVVKKRGGWKKRRYSKKPQQKPQKTTEPKKTVTQPKQVRGAAIAQGSKPIQKKPLPKPAQKKESFWGPPNTPAKLLPTKLRPLGGIRKATATQASANNEANASEKAAGPRKKRKRQPWERNPQLQSPPPRVRPPTRASIPVVDLLDPEIENKPAEKTRKRKNDLLFEEASKIIKKSKPNTSVVKTSPTTDVTPVAAVKKTVEPPRSDNVAKKSTMGVCRGSIGKTRNVAVKRGMPYIKKTPRGQRVAEPEPICGVFVDANCGGGSTDMFINENEDSQTDIGSDEYQSWKPQTKRAKPTSTLFQFHNSDNEDYNIPSGWRTSARVSPGSSRQDDYPKCEVKIQRMPVIDRLLPPKPSPKLEPNICELCDPKRIFLSKVALADHINEEHISKSLETFVTATVESPSNDLTVCMKETSLSCLGCKKRFQCKSVLATHLKTCKEVSAKTVAAKSTIESIPGVDLSLLGKSVTISKAAPAKKETEESPEASGSSSIMKYTCQMCKRRFLMAAGLASHMKVHNRTSTQTNLPSSSQGKNNLMCNICDKTFNHCSDLVEHMSFHSLTSEKEKDILATNLSRIGNIQIKLEKREVVVVESSSEDDESSNNCSDDSSDFSDYEKKEPRRPVKQLECSTNKCLECGRLFTIKSVYERHVSLMSKISSLEDQTRCPVCNLEVNLRCKLGAHIETHKPRSEEQLTCKKCNKTFRCENNLIRHELEHEGKLRVSCQYCNDHFSTMADLYVHQDECKFKCSEYKCNICRRVFTAKWRLDLHMKTDEKHGTDPQQPNTYFCDQCGREFKHLSVLKRHVDSRCGTEPLYECTDCNKKYFSQGSLASHKRTQHSTEKNYMCQYCSKDFFTKHQLHRHELRHNPDVRPYRCKFQNCDKTYRQPDSLRAHECEHTGLYPYACEFCGVQFSNVKSLKLHRKSSNHWSDIEPNKVVTQACRLRHGARKYGEEEPRYAEDKQASEEEDIDPEGQEDEPKNLVISENQYEGIYPGDRVSITPQVHHYSTLQPFTVNHIMQHNQQSPVLVQSAHQLASYTQAIENYFVIASHQEPVTGSHNHSMMN